MNGLLDFVKTPEGQGLLSAAFGGLAGARRGQPINSLGRAGLAGLAGYSGAQDRALQADESAFNKTYKTMQLTKMQQDMEADRARGEYLRNLSGAPTAALGAGAALGDVGPTKTNAARLDGIVPPSLQRIPRAALEAEIALNGGKNVPEWLFKTGAPDMQVSNGYAYDKNNVQPGFMPQFSVSNDGKATKTEIGPDGQPVVSAPAGALATYGAYRNLDASTTAAYDTMPITLPDGTTVLTTRGAVVEGGRRPTTPAPSTRPSGNFTGTGYAGGSAANASNEQRLIMTRERQNAVAAGNTELVAALDRELARLPAATQGAAPNQGGASPVPGIQVQSEAEKQAAIVQAKNNVEAQSPEAIRKATQRTEAVVNSAKNVLSALDDAIGLTGFTTAGPASGFASVPGTDARNLQAKIETIKANLGFNELQKMRDMSPTGGALGSVAVQELTALQSTVSSLDQGQSPAQLKASFQKIKKHYQAWVDAVKEGGKDPAAPTRGNVVKTGMYNGRKVVQYEDGTTDYAD